MSDRDSLIAAILANPDEDTPRLMFADWLDEHGDPARAEFIRVQCELARQRAAEIDLPESFGTTCGSGGKWPMSWRPHDTEERLALLSKESELLNAHSDEWRQGLPKYADNRLTQHVVRFRRGFVGHAMVALGRLVAAPAALWKNHPVESLHLSPINGEARHKIPTCKPLVAVRELSLFSQPFNQSLMSPFADCPYLSNLWKLDLGYTDVRDDGARALARSPHLRPTWFRLGTQQGLSEGAFVEMLNSPFASRLRQFNLWHVPGWGPEAVASAPLGELRLLNLSSNQAGDAGVKALTRSKYLTQLVTLDLGYSHLTDAALEALAAWPGLVSVQSLNLGDNKSVTARGVGALLKSSYFKPSYLGLRYTAVDDSGARALAAWPGLANLIDLDLSYACLDDPGLVALTDSPHWRDIRYLKLNGNRLTSNAATRIRGRLGAPRVDIWG